MATKNHYLKLRKYFPRGYRLTIKELTGASISTINFVLRGKRPDNDGILVEAYKIASVEAKKKNENAKILADIQDELNKYTL